MSIGRLVRGISGESSNSESLTCPGIVATDPALFSLGSQVLSSLTLMLMSQPLRTSGTHRITSRMIGQRNTHRLALTHDYILVQFDSVNGRWIKAEKGKDSKSGKNQAGIRLSIVDALNRLDLSGDQSDAEIRFEANIVELGEGKEEWTLGKVLTLMSQDSPHYNIMTSNCWAHSFSGTMAVLQWFRTNASSPEVKKALKKNIKGLKVLERTMPADFMKSLADRSVSASVETRRTFNQTLAHTIENLPSSSRFRRKGVSIVQNFFTEGNCIHPRPPKPLQLDGNSSSSSLSVEAAQGEAPLLEAPQGEAPLLEAPQGEAPLLEAPQVEAPQSISRSSSTENVNNIEHKCAPCVRRRGRSI